ncbi:MAG: pantetheine-phosphate adenylyltransferase [bacterium]|nr:pantetheine-phosphate adenylyltransferase [bacterium]
MSPHRKHPGRKAHIALYPGTFDGLTYGHLDIIQRGSNLFDCLHVAVAHNEEKKPIFTVDERLEILRTETAHLPNVVVSTFLGLTMDYAEKLGANYVIRGIRAVSDFEYELQMALMNRALNPRVETLFMVPAAQQLFVSSSLIKEVLLLGGDVNQFVPPSTERMLRQKLNIPDKHGRNGSGI